MSRFFPHPPYAEDQPFSKTILTTHVLHRGFTAGALVGPLIGLPYYYFSKSSVPRTLSSTIFRSAGVGTVVGTGLLSIGLAARMRDKEPIEWSDRSWRLLENKGQVEVDDWSCGGAIMGAAATVAARTNMGWRGLLGGAGLGSLVGVGGYMVWRHGVNGGTWEEDKSLSA
jgi:hypothetical protein